MDVQRINGPDTVGHYNVYPAALIQGATLPGVSSGQAIEKMERTCRENLPSQFSFEWTQYGEQSPVPSSQKGLRRRSQSVEKADFWRNLLSFR